MCLLSKKTVKMNSRISALLIKLSKYPHVSDFAIDCHLEIKAPTNMGLQVIIEDMNLRRNPLDNECDDYVWVSSCWTTPFAAASFFAQPFSSFFLPLYQPLIYQSVYTHLMVTFCWPKQFGRDDDGFLSNKLCGQRKLAPISDIMQMAPAPEPTWSWSGEDPAGHQQEQRATLVESLIPDGPEATTFYDPGGKLHIWFRKTSRKVDQNLQPLRLNLVITAYRISEFMLTCLLS